MSGIESTQLKLLVIALGVGGQGEETLHEFLMSSAAPLCEKLAGVVGIFEVAVSVIVSWMTGDEFVVVIDTEAVGVGLEC